MINFALNTLVKYSNKQTSLDAPQRTDPKYIKRADPRPFTRPECHVDQVLALSFTQSFSFFMFVVCNSGFSLLVDLYESNTI